MSVTLDNLPITQMIGELGVPLWWKPRLGTTQSSAYGLLTGTDPHQPTGGRCPVCYNTTAQRPQSSVCTTCYGTGWTGGFAAGVSLNGVITTASYQFQMQETGELLSVAGTWLLTNPADGELLPQDLVAVQATPAVRYLVGQLAKDVGVLGMAFARIVQLEPLAPDSPWKAVPIP